MNEQEKYDWMVYVSCMTFNHSPYIVDAMNGFTMQETNFPFVCAIVDDASTDGEQEVIKKYLNEHFDLEDKSIARHEETDDYVLSFARHKTNLNCHFAVFYLKYNHYSIKKSKLPYLVQWRDRAKYIALCEGDDYWIHPKKLQKQVDFLEANPDCGLVHTNRYNKRGDKLIKVKARNNYDAISVLLRTGIGTLTTCYRSDLHFKYLEEVQPQNKGWLMGDSPLWKYIAFKSKIHLLPDYTAVYRILTESASHSRDINKRLAFAKSILDIQKFMLDKFVLVSKQKNETQSQIISESHLRYFNIYYDFKRNREAITYLKEHREEIKICDIINLSMVRKIATAVVCVLWHAEKK